MAIVSLSLPLRGLLSASELVAGFFSRTFFFLFSSFTRLRRKNALSHSPTQAKHTKKQGIVGKYGTRYGASLRKIAKKIEITQHAVRGQCFCFLALEHDSSNCSLLDVQLPLLRTYRCEASGCGNLEVPWMQQDLGWRSLRYGHHCCRHCSLDHPSSPRTAGQKVNQYLRSCVKILYSRERFGEGHLLSGEGYLLSGSEID